MRLAFDTAVRLFADQPLIALSLTIFVGIPLMLGWMHEARFFAECALIGIQFFKHEASAWRDFIKRLLDELSSWWK